MHGQSQRRDGGTSGQRAHCAQTDAVGEGLKNSGAERAEWRSAHQPQTTSTAAFPHPCGPFRLCSVCLSTCAAVFCPAFSFASFPSSCCLSVFFSSLSVSVNCATTNMAAHRIMDVCHQTSMDTTSDTQTNKRTDEQQSKGQRRNEEERRAFRTHIYRPVHRWAGWI